VTEEVTEITGFAEVTEVTEVTESTEQDSHTEARGKRRNGDALLTCPVWSVYFV
jgi:hypothetical protein